MADYLQELETKLQGSRKRLKEGNEMKHLKAAAPTLFDIIDGEITLLVNKMTSKDPLDYDAYLSTHGQVVGIRKIRDLINSKETEAVQASQEVTAIEGTLKQIKDDKAQQR